VLVGLIARFICMVTGQTISGESNLHLARPRGRITRKEGRAGTRARGTSAAVWNQTYPPSDPFMTSSLHPSVTSFGSSSPLLRVIRKSLRQRRLPHFAWTRKG